MVSMSMIDDIALMYAKMRPNDLPTDVYMHVTVYTEFMRMLQHRITLTTPSDGVQNLIIHTGCGPLTAHAMPYAFDKFVMLIGKQEDYDRYFIDEVFEDIVLKDCERE